MVNDFLFKLRKAESEPYISIKRTFKIVRRANLPTIPYLSATLYNLHKGVSILIRSLKEKLYLTPTFRSQLDVCGKGLRVCGSMPFLMGNNVKMIFGDNVTIVGHFTVFGNTVFPNSFIKVGDNSNLGWGLTISCADSVKIGDNCKIACDVFISDNTSHNLEPERRDDPLDVKNITPVSIGNNVWIGSGAKILKGCVIGDGSIIGAGVVLSGAEIPPNSVVVGSGYRIRV